MLKKSLYIVQVYPNLGHMSLPIERRSSIETSRIRQLQLLSLNVL